MIEILFTLTKAEYIEAQSLFLEDQMRLSRKWRWPLAGLLLAVAAGLALRSRKPFSLNLLSSYRFSLFVMGVGLLCLGPLMRRGFAKRFEKEKANVTDARVWLDDAGYHSDVPSMGSGVAEWSGIESWREGKQVFVLRSGYLMRMLPKSALSPYEQHQVREFLSRKILRRD